MIRHTKSFDGRVHRLTHTGAPTGNLRKIPGAIHYVELRYRTAPRFDDQVQGDLIRKFWKEHPGVQDVIGRVPFSPQIDPALK